MPRNERAEGSLGEAWRTGRRTGRGTGCGGAARRRTFAPCGWSARGARCSDTRRRTRASCRPWAPSRFQNIVVIPVPPPSLTDVLVRTRRPLGLNLLPRIEPKPRPDVDAVKILRDAAKQRRKNGEKFSTMAPDEVLKQQLKHLFGESDSQGSEPDAAGGGVLGAPPRAPPPASMQPRVEPAARPPPPRTAPIGTPPARSRRRRRLASDPPNPRGGSGTSSRPRMPTRRTRTGKRRRGTRTERAGPSRGPSRGASPTRTNGRSRRRFGARPTEDATTTTTAARRGARRPPGGRTRRRGTRRGRGDPTFERRLPRGSGGRKPPRRPQRRRRHPEHATGDDRRL